MSHEINFNNNSFTVAKGPRVERIKILFAEQDPIEISNGEEGTMPEDTSTRMIVYWKGEGSARFDVVNGYSFRGDRDITIYGEHYPFKRLSISQNPCSPLTRPNWKYGDCC